MIGIEMTGVSVSGDAELVKASLAGERDAFGQIVSRYQSLICSVAYTATGSLSQSEDLAQETFLAAWKHLAELREPEKLRAWLCGIARNLVNSSLRQQGREPSHRAESLDDIPESHATEPLPVERAISNEEADLLWRSLERVPEIYRLPLVLFYREHQSIEAMAQRLELTEEAARQRLSRGRKLLQREVQSFVEGALERTAPGKTFTVAVVAALPMAITSAKAASIGATLAKTGAGGKSLIPFAAWAGFLSLLGAIAFSWKTAVDDSRSDRERKFMKRIALYQMAVFAVTLVICFFWLPHERQRPWLIAGTVGALILANIVNGSFVNLYMLRRRMQIRCEDGTLTEPFPADDEALKRNALLKSLRLAVPFLIMIAGLAISLPWKQHWLRSSALMLGELLIVLWFCRKMYRRMSFQEQPRIDINQATARNALIRIPLIILGSAILGGVLGSLMPFFLNPESTHPGILRDVWFGPIGISLLVCVVVFGALAIVFRKRITQWGWLVGKLPAQFAQQFQAMKQGPDAITEMTYAPIFEQLELLPDQRTQLKELILKRTMVGVRLGMSMVTSWKRDPAKRAELIRGTRTDTDQLSAQIKEFLGADNYAAFQEFEKTIPDRTMLNELKTRTANSPAAMTPEQHSRLLDMLAEARRQYPWTTELSRRTHDTAPDLGAVFTAENLETFADEEEQFDTQFLMQARELLSAEQLAAFARAQQRRREGQVAQLKIAARMFGSADK